MFGKYNGFIPLYYFCQQDEGCIFYSVSGVHGYNTRAASRKNLYQLQTRLHVLFKTHEQQCFFRYKTGTANLLNCFKSDRSSKFIGEVIFKKYVV
jgi:hypothetical protein